MFLPWCTPKTCSGIPQFHSGLQGLLEQRQGTAAQTQHSGFHGTILIIKGIQEPGLGWVTSRGQSLTFFSFLCPRAQQQVQDRNHAGDLRVSSISVGSVLAISLIQFAALAQKLFSVPQQIVLSLIPSQVFNFLLQKLQYVWSSLSKHKHPILFHSVKHPL